MTKFVPAAMALLTLGAATAMGLASPAFSQGVPRVECYQSWVPAIQNCHAVSNDLGYSALGYVSPGGRSAPTPALAQYGPPQSPGIGPNGTPDMGCIMRHPAECIMRHLAWVPRAAAGLLPTAASRYVDASATDGCIDDS
jgi:hypothetical protein